jgi:hypothetical protein
MIAFVARGLPENDGSVRLLEASEVPKVGVLPITVALEG